MRERTLGDRGLRVMVIGGGGREHALAWKLAQSPRVDRVYCAPGNAGTAEIAENVPIDPMDFDTLVAFARQSRIDLTVVGPCDPLVAGIVDHFEAAGLAIFGPNLAQAELEGSKAFSKAFMRRHQIPTARYASFTDAAAAHQYVDEHWRPEGIVVKPDGVAAVEGTLVTDDREAAHAEIERALSDRRYGEAGARVLIEERLVGPEASILAFVDGFNYRALLPAQDHKQLLDGGLGPNTEGMGAYAPAPLVDAALAERIHREIMAPTLRGLMAEGLGFAGVLFVGVLVTAEGPKLLEYNCRFGDPEAQVTLPAMQNDLVDVIEACLEGRLSELTLAFDPHHYVCVVASAAGYPAIVPSGELLTGLEAAGNVAQARLFHGRTLPTPEGPRANGGRLVNVVARGASLAEAQRIAYEAVGHVRVAGVTPHFRRDIGALALGKEPIRRPLETTGANA